MNKKRLSKIAVHEAGHLLVALALGVKVYEAVLRHRPRICSSGFIKPKEFKQPTLNNIECDIALTIAGNLSELLYSTPKSGWRLNSDIKEALKLLLDIYYYEPKYSDLNQDEGTTFLVNELLLRKSAVTKFLKSREAKAHIYILAQMLMTKRQLKSRDLVLLSRSLKAKNGRSFRLKIARQSGLLL